MSKIRRDYEQSRAARFLRWLAGAPSDGLDRHMEDALAKDDAQTTEQDEHALRELRRARRHQEDIERERAAHERVHAYATTRGAKLVDNLYRLLALLIAGSIIYFLLTTVVQLPPFGEATNPDNNEVSARYIERGLQETGATNIVAGMILDYRAFDTLGESTVLFIALCSVLILLRIDRDKDGNPTQELIAAENDDRHHEPKNDLILQTAARLLTPIIVLFGAYVILNGHLSPGGGFSGGAIIGAGLILYLNAFGFRRAERFLTQKTMSLVSFCSLMFYACAKSYSFFTGANHLESGIPLGVPGAILSSGLILPLNVCVGLVVTCTMYSFYAMFRKGGL